jgi:hypothetical protein
VGHWRTAGKHPQRRGSSFDRLGPCGCAPQVMRVAVETSYRNRSIWFPTSSMRSCQERSDSRQMSRACAATAWALDLSSQSNRISSRTSRTTLQNNEPQSRRSVIASAPTNIRPKRQKRQRFRIEARRTDPERKGAQHVVRL